jgi:hypothetical protein
MMEGFFDVPKYVQLEVKLMHLSSIVEYTLGIMSQEDKLEILGFLESFDHEYRFLLEVVYDFQIYNTNNFLYSVQFLHMQIAHSANIFRQAHPLYVYRQLDPRNDSTSFEYFDVTDGDLERLFKRLSEIVDSIDFFE